MSQTLGFFLFSVRLVYAACEVRILMASICFLRYCYEKFGPYLKQKVLLSNNKDLFYLSTAKGKNINKMSLH